MTRVGTAADLRLPSIWSQRFWDYDPNYGKPTRFSSFPCSDFSITVSICVDLDQEQIFSLRDCKAASIEEKVGVRLCCHKRAYFN